MIQDIEINSLQDATKLFLDQEYNHSINRLRSAYFFRGMPNIDFKLQTSLQRNCKELQSRLEPALLRNFSKYASIEDPSLDDSIWIQMIVGQHHGLATRLLDWTHSPLIALHFAETEGNLDMLSQHDCVVWRIDARDLNTNLPPSYINVLDKENTFIFSISTLNQVAPSIQQYDLDMKNDSFVLLEPPSIDQRIINQYSFFSVIPSEMTDIEAFLDSHTKKTVRYVISKKIRWDLRDVLDQYNVNERIIYPGLDGIAKWVTRHYYKKN